MYDVWVVVIECMKVVRCGEKGDGVVGTERRARDDDDESDWVLVKVIEEGECDEWGCLGE